MPTNFPEVWSKRVEYNLESADEAPWLEGVQEMDAEVTMLGEGTPTESNIIHIPVSEFEIDVLVNNTAYPLAVQAFTDTEVTLKLDKYQTKVGSLTDDQALGASYPRIDAVTRGMTQPILTTKYAKAIHSIAPADNSAATPVILSTGGAEATAIDGRLILVYEDLVTLKRKVDTLKVPKKGRRLVLCSDHWNDLLLDRKRFGDNFANYRTGQLAPVVAGFEIYEYIANPVYTGTEKNAWGAAAEAGDYEASVFFYVPNIAKKTGMTKQYFRPSGIDPTNQTNQLAYRHYFIATPKRAKYIGAIVSAPEPEA